MFPGSPLLHGDYQSDQPSVQLTAGSLPLLKFSKTETVCKQRVRASAESSMSGLCLAAPCHKNTLNAFLMSCFLPLSSCAPVVRMVSHAVLGLSNPWAASRTMRSSPLLWSDSAHMRVESIGGRRDFEEAAFIGKLQLLNCESRDLWSGECCPVCFHPLPRSH